MMKNKLIIFPITVGIVLVGVLSFRFLVNETTDTAESSLVETNENATEEMHSSDSVTVEELAFAGETNPEVLSSVSYEIITDNFTFAPDKIEVYAGQEVTVKIVNEAGVHDFIIDELDVHTDHVDKSGDELEVAFIIPENASGEYEFYCSIGNHRELGMVGHLVVMPL